MLQVPEAGSYGESGGVRQRKTSASAMTSIPAPTPLPTLPTQNMSKSDSKDINDHPVDDLGGMMVAPVVQAFSNDRRQPTCLERVGYHFHLRSHEAHIRMEAVSIAMLYHALEEDTTAHGLPHIANAHGFVKKTAWTMITIVAVVMLGVNLSQLFQNFFSFNFDVIIEMEYERELTFPAVTVCNMNPVKYSMIGLVPELERLINNTNYNDSTGSVYDDNAVPRESFTAELRLAEILSGVPMATRQKIGYQPWEFILDCQYAGYDCYWQDFFPIYNTIHGNCYSFNTGWNNKSLLVSHQTGRRYGLQLIININQAEYLPGISESAGARLVIHNRLRMPFPQDEGIVLNPGVLTSIGISQMNVERLDPPYDSCVHDGGFLNVSLNAFEEYYNVSYSANACYKTCYQRYLINICGCGDPEVPLKSAAFNNNNVTACNSEDDADSACMLRVTAQFNNNELECNECQLECNDTSYNLDISTCQWPSDVQRESLLEKLGMSGSTNYQSNLLKIEIYYEEFNYQKMAERASYSASQFASDIGGTIGLWVGCSVLSLLEFFEFFVDVAVLLCLRLSMVSRVKRFGNYNRTQQGGQMQRMPPKQQAALSLTPPPPYSSPSSSVAAYNNKFVQYEDLENDDNSLPLWFV